MSNKTVSPSGSSINPTLGNLPSRSSRSCTECARRKTKCDHEVPCSACIKRGQASSCTAPVKRKRGFDAVQELDERRTSALAELELFKNTLDSLRARLPNLEYFVANSGVQDLESTEFEEITRHFGKTDVGPSRSRSFKADDEDSSEMPKPKKKPRDTSQDAATDREGTDGGDDAAAVDAAVSLEYATLGRSRALPASLDRSMSESPSDDAFLMDARDSITRKYTPPSPISAYPNGASLLAVSPSPEQENVIFRHGLDLLGWHHRVFHGPTFYTQVATFRELGADRFEEASPAWLALYFALLSVSTQLLGESQQQELGWSEEDTCTLASRWFDCAVSNLYRHNFLEHHQLMCLQAIAVVALSGRDAGSPTLTANLLSAGLSIAQDMGLHRMSSDETFLQTQHSIRSKTARSKELIEREMKKRVFWALTHTDYFSIPFRSSWILGKVQISTPLPMNITDDELSGGEAVQHPPSVWTPASWLLQYIDIGRSMCEAAEQSQLVKSDAAYQEFLKVDSHLASITKNPPAWLEEEAKTETMPDCVSVMKSTFMIALHHKILCIHRPYLYRPFKGKVVEFSRGRVIDSARAILREAPNVKANRIWTVAYHLSAAAFIVILELFDRQRKANRPEADLDTVRAEIRGALAVLDSLKSASTIARRGLTLVQPLMMEEQRLREEAAKQALLQSSRSLSSGFSSVPALQQQYASPAPNGHGYQAPLSHSIPYPLHPAHPYPLPPIDQDGPYQIGSSSRASEPPFPTWYFEASGDQSEHWLHSQLSSAWSGPGTLPMAHMPIDHQTHGDWNVMNGYPSMLP